MDYLLVVVIFLIVLIQEGIGKLNNKIKYGDIK